MVASDLCADVNDFLGEFNAQKGMQLTRDAFPVVPASHYPPSLMLSDQATAISSPRSFNRSIRSNSTYMSSCFQTNTSISTAPPPHGPPPPHRQRPSLPTASLLVCEFVGFQACDALFDPDDEESWISHIVDHHLNNILPRVSMCWFCNDVPRFKAVSKSHEDREVCFRERMSHIAWHFRNGCSREQMRPDFFFLDHVHQHGLISEDVFQWAKRFHEVPQIPNLYPAGWRPGQQEEVVVEAEVGRSHRRHHRSGRDRGPQGYYR
ncbi:hypothetical protein NW755_006033 [Fusarium falciforme]|uniref:Uncharacterized protein n=1 Tax=Fusarium falciforme TaxID=195108 RepID=A0A9W8V1R1_9HYPO|nr:hypothetical protein NW755_006033 [Fusarium falciforme]